VEIPSGINPGVNPDAVSPENDLPRYTPLEQLVLAAAPLAEMTRVVVEGLHKSPPEIFTGQAMYVQEQANVVTLDGRRGGPIHLVAIAIPAQLAVNLQRAFQAARGTKLAKGLAAKCGDPQLGARVQIHRPNAADRG